jgi:hypothetical protein
MMQSPPSLLSSLFLFSDFSPSVLCDFSFNSHRSLPGPPRSMESGGARRARKRGPRIRICGVARAAAEARCRGRYLRRALSAPIIFFLFPPEGKRKKILTRSETW